MYTYNIHIYTYKYTYIYIYIYIHINMREAYRSLVRRGRRNCPRRAGYGAQGRVVEVGPREGEVQAVDRGASSVGSMHLFSLLVHPQL